MKKLITFITLVFVSWCVLASLFSNTGAPEANTMPQTDPPRSSLQEDKDGESYGEKWQEFTENVKDTLSSLDGLAVGTVNELDQLVPQPLKWICGGGWLVIFVLLLMGMSVLKLVGRILQL
jgi:hypothetical protein